jgi:fatty acid desaturase
MTVVDPQKKLARTLLRMSEISPSQGLTHAAIHTVLFLGLVISFGALWQRDTFLAVIITLPMALVYTAIVVTSHDCIHHTYTGIKRFDDYWPLIWLWVVFWPHRTYSEIHKIHHALLGRDFDDPERPTFLKSEFEKSGVVRRWYIRHQWIVNIFIFGGAGFIVKHWLTARRLSKRFPQLTIAMQRDKIGLIAVSVVTWLIYLYFNIFTEYLITFFVLERIGGGLLQMRALAEHYGLWEGRNTDPVTRQAMSCRNIKAGWLGRWLYNDLCFHSIHHIYPSIPWYKLGEAHLTILPLLKQINPKQLEPKDSYGKVLADGVRSWRLIDDSVVMASD